MILYIHQVWIYLDSNPYVEIFYHLPNFNSTSEVKCTALDKYLVCSHCIVCHEHFDFNRLQPTFLVYQSMYKSYTCIKADFASYPALEWCSQIRAFISILILYLHNLCHCGHENMCLTYVFYIL